MNLNNIFGGGSFMQFSIVLFIVTIVIVILMFYFSPAQVLARAIKELKKQENKKMYISDENDEYYIIDSGVRILKQWYDKKSDCFICEYGTYIPIYNYDNRIIAFLFMRK